jgi:hypothetical protein
MKKNAIDVHPQFIINKTGKKTGVILDIVTFERIMEKLEDSYLVAQAEDVMAHETEYYDLAKVKKKLLSKK